MPAIDMDDLIASFASTAHISQEAMDIATLQKQLAQTLHQYNVNPCAIPSTQGAVTSPSTSSWMGRDMCHRNRSTSQSRRFPSQERSWRPSHRQQQGYDAAEVDDDELDAQMVEQELAFGYSPASASSMGRQQPHPSHGHALSNSSSTETMIGGQQMQMQMQMQMHDPWYSTSPHAPSSNASSFQDSASSTGSSFAAYAAIDPFFAAQLQAASAVYGASPAGFSSSHHHAFAAPN